MKLNWSDAPGLAGLALVGVGLWHFSWAVCLIVIGSALVFYSYKVGK